jgi:hypothetical protein
MPVGGISVGSLSDAILYAVASTGAQQNLQALTTSLASGDATGSAPACPDGNGTLINVMA